MKRKLLSQMLRAAILLLLFFGWGAGSSVAYGAGADSGLVYGVEDRATPHEVGIEWEEGSFTKAGQKSGIDDPSSISKTNELVATDRFATLPGLSQDFKPFVLDHSFEEFLFGALHKFKSSPDALSQIIGKVSDLGPSKMPDLLADLKLIDAQGNAIGDDLLEFLLSADDIAVFERRLGAWDALSSTGLATDANIWLPRVSNWIDEGIEFVESGTKVIIRKGGNDVGEIVDDILHVKFTGFGADVVCDAGKTTTCVGKWNGGTGTIWNNGLAGQGANPGGVNILGDVPTGLDDLTLWNTVNKPWLESAVSRGDVIRAVSDPTINSNIYRPDGTISFFGREHQHLTNPISQGGLGYTFDAQSFSYIK